MNNLIEEGIEATLRLKNAQEVAENYVKMKLPKILKEIDQSPAFATNLEVDGRQDLGLILGKHIAMAYALGYMDGFDKQKLTKLYI